MKICEEKAKKEFSWVEEGGDIVREQNHCCQDFKINKCTERTCTIEVSPPRLFLGRIHVVSDAKPGLSCFGRVWQDRRMRGFFPAKGFEGKNGARHTLGFSPG